ncbi:MAG: hypothetical protein ACLQPD_03020 [Desulfomonilaceae bacterium]
MSKGRKKNSAGGKSIDSTAIKANVAELDENIDFEGLKSSLSEDQCKEFAVTACEWLQAEVDGKDGKPLNLSEQVRQGLVDLAERLLVVQAISSNNALESVYRNGMVADQVIKLLEGCRGGAKRGFLGWCQEHGVSRSTMYRDRRLATVFGEDIKKCAGISENKLNTCATQEMTVEWVLEHKQELIEAPNVDAVKRICKRPQSEESTNTADKEEETFKPFKRKDGSLGVRIVGLTKDEVMEIEKLYYSLPSVMSKALDTDEESEPVARQEEITPDQTIPSSSEDKAENEEPLSAEVLFKAQAIADKVANDLNKKLRKAGGLEGFTAQTTV